MPIAYRYALIFRNQDSLSHWWSVILIRILLTIVTMANLGYWKCQYAENLKRFWGLLAPEDALVASFNG
jgi:hypothetical protein